MQKGTVKNPKKNKWLPGSKKGLGVIRFICNEKAYC